MYWFYDDVEEVEFLCKELFLLKICSSLGTLKMLFFDFPNDFLMRIEKLPFLTEFFL